MEITKKLVTMGEGDTVKEENSTNWIWVMILKINMGVNIY